MSELIKAWLATHAVTQCPPRPAYGTYFPKREPLILGRRGVR